MVRTLREQEIIGMEEPALSQEWQRVDSCQAGCKKESGEHLTGSEHASSTGHTPNSIGE